MNFNVSSRNRPTLITPIPWYQKVHHALTLEVILIRHLRLNRVSQPLRLVCVDTLVFFQLRFQRTAAKNTNMKINFRNFHFDWVVRSDAYSMYRTRIPIIVHVDVIHKNVRFVSRLPPTGHTINTRMSTANERLTRPNSPKNKRKYTYLYRVGTRRAEIQFFGDGCLVNFFFWRVEGSRLTGGAEPLLDDPPSPNRVHVLSFWCTFLTSPVGAYYISKTPCDLHCW